MFALNQLLFAALYLVPFFRILQGVRTALFVSLMLLGHIILNATLAPRTTWYMSFVDNDKRGIFTARKEAVSLVSGILFQFCMSAVIDHFEAEGNIRAALVACTLVILVLSVGHTLSLLFTKDRDVPESKHTLLQELKTTVADRKIRSLLVLSILWAICHSVSIPFYGTYTIPHSGIHRTWEICRQNLLCTDTAAMLLHDRFELCCCCICPSFQWASALCGLQHIECHVHGRHQQRGDQPDLRLCCPRPKDRRPVGKKYNLWSHGVSDIFSGNSSA